MLRVTGRQNLDSAQMNWAFHYLHLSRHSIPKFGWHENFQLIWLWSTVPSIGEIHWHGIFEQWNRFSLIGSLYQNTQLILSFGFIPAWFWVPHSSALTRSRPIRNSVHRSVEKYDYLDVILFYRAHQCETAHDSLCTTVWSYAYTYSHLLWAISCTITYPLSKLNKLS